MIEILILSLVQGITEFLPVSSSSHLILISEYFEFKNQNLSIDVSLHIGSFFAVIVFFKEEIFDFVKNKKLLIKVVISSIPTLIVGFILIKYNLIEKIRNLEVIAWTTIMFAILLYISDKFDLSKRVDNDFTIKSAIIIGIFQILSLIPGVSRSGITITAARFLKFKRYDSAKISFLLSIPTLAVISIYGLKNSIDTGNLNFSVTNLTSIILSFIISYLTIKFFLNFLMKFSLNIFVIYRIILGASLLIIFYS
tara:strand:+ start:382 stop:1140 length:759 start_codon:yes stop_codon:yes gene_type:complete